jgi:hypothetical protein
VDDVFKEYNNFNNVKDIDFIIQLTKIYTDLLNLKRGINTKYLNESDANFEELCEKLRVINNVLKIRDTFNPIIILLLLKYNMGVINNYGEICDYLNILIKFGFLQFKLYRSVGNVDIRSTVDKIIRGIDNNDNINKINKIMFDEIQNNNVEFRTTYVNKINELKVFENFHKLNLNKDLIKFILFEYYKSKEDDETEGLIFDKLSIEHIIPRKYMKNYSFLKTNYTEEEIESAIKSIGNLLLLVLKANQIISNKTTDDKIKYYKKSKFNENKEFATSIEQKPNDILNQIIDRHSKIIDFMGDYFKI